MCIADKIEAALNADGWEKCRAPGGGAVFDRIIVGWAKTGVMVPDGRRRVYLHLSESGRWFERMDAWGEVEKALDLREFNDAGAAIAAVLEKGK